MKNISSKSSKCWTKSFFLCEKKLFCWLEKIFEREKNLQLEKKKRVLEKYDFSEKRNVSGNECWLNEYFIRLEHLENLRIVNLIMWEISEGKEMSSDSWERSF